MKLQQTIPKEKLERSKKYRLTEKEVLKVKFWKRNIQKKKFIIVRTTFSNYFLLLFSLFISFFLREKINIQVII